MSDYIKIARIASTIDAIERDKIAYENKYRQYTRTETDKDGEERGFGLTDADPEVAMLKKHIDDLQTNYDMHVKALQKAMKEHPLGAWVKSQMGLGEKTIARLIGVIGDPYWNDLYDRPRTVSELWAYCGQHVVEGSAPKRKKGQQGNWSTVAKMRLYNIVDPIIKCRTSPYRAYYDKVKAGYTDTVDPKTGKPRSKMHIENMTRRRVQKEILKDLYNESKRIHESA